jgi:hypothetical protein
MEASNLTKELTHLAHRVNFLEEENRWLKSQLFGRSSEKRPQDIAVAAPVQRGGGPRRQRGYGERRDRGASAQEEWR